MPGLKLIVNGACGLLLVILLILLAKSLIFPNGQNNIGALLCTRETLIHRFGTADEASYKIERISIDKDTSSSVYDIGFEYGNRVGTITLLYQNNQFKVLSLESSNPVSAQK